MPALYLFNRRTLLAGDDLQLPSIAWGLLSAAQTFLLLPYLLYFTIELLLLRGSGDDEYDGKNESVWRRQRYNDRNLLDVDDVIDSVEKQFPNLRSSECAQATSNFDDMTFPSLVLIYLIGMSIFCAISLWYEQKIFRLSSLGTPTLNIDLRDPLSMFIERKMTRLAGFNFLLLVFASACTFNYIGDYLHCFPAMWWVLWFVLLATQGLQFLFAFTTYVSIMRVHPSTTRAIGMAEVSGAAPTDFYQQHTEHFFHNHNNTEIAEEIWRGRCEGCCKVLALSTCFLFGGQSIVSHASEGGSEKFYGDISRALADYFAGFVDESTGEPGLDVVPSDVALGFVVLRHIQAQRKLIAKREALQQAGYGSRPGSSVDLTQLTNGTTSIINRRTLFFRWRNSSSHEQNVVSDADNNTARQNSACDVSNQPIPSRADEEYQSFSRIVLSPSNADDFAVIEEGARFARHQLAIYTWMLYYYMYPVSGTFRLIGRALKEKMCDNNSAECVESDSHVVGDNFLRIHEATMLAHAGLEKADIAYASFEAGFYETPYCIVIDRKWKTVVLSIRGSLTLEDCVVDVLLDPSSLSELGVQYGFAGDQQYCHGGVLECTQWLYADLNRYGDLGIF